MRLMLQVEVSDDLLKGLKGTTEDSYKICKILDEAMNSKDIVTMEAINRDYIVHRLTDEDLDIVLETMEDHIQEYFEDQDNYDELARLIFMKAEFGWAEDLEQAIDRFYGLMTDQE